jgi:hypothetical protein
MGAPTRKTGAHELNAYPNTVGIRNERNSPLLRSAHDGSHMDWAMLSKKSEGQPDLERIPVTLHIQHERRSWYRP